MYPLHRFVHWMTHEDGVEPSDRKQLLKDS
jgi:hypothetical protein